MTMKPDLFFFFFLFGSLILGIGTFLFFFLSFFEGNFPRNLFFSRYDTDRAFIEFRKCSVCFENLSRVAGCMEEDVFFRGPEEIAYEMNPVFPVVPLRDWRWCTTRL